MKIYNYDPESLRFIGESLADESPLEPGVFLVPAYATELAPPSVPEGRVAVYIPEHGGWSIESRPAPVSPPEPPPPTVEHRIAALKSAMAARLDAAAQERGYDDIKSAALRAGYAGPYQAEGMAFATWMDATWHQGYALLAQWQAGQLAEPTVAELLAMLPVLTLPGPSHA